MRLYLRYVLLGLILVFSGCIAPKVQEIKQPKENLQTKVTLQDTKEEDKKVLVGVVEKPLKDETPKASLTNTYWKLIFLNAQEVKMKKTQRRDIHIVLSDGKVRGYSGCNHFSGKYKVESNELSFSDRGFMSTRMFCRNNMEYELLGALKTMRYYKISGENLEIFDSKHKRLAKFVSVYLY